MEIDRRRGEIDRRKEVDFAMMQRDVREIKTTVKCLADKLTGDNKSPGLMTKVALNKQSIKRLWWLNGAAYLALLSMGVKMGFESFKQWVLRQ